MDIFRIKEIESILMYNFKEKKLLREALTHPSTNLDYSFERLEFIGDSVLNLVIGETLFKIFPDTDEGKLTRIRSRIVSKASLSDVAKNITIGKYIFLSKGEEVDGGREKPSILSSVIEALIGAIFIDGGLDEARNFISRLFGYDFLFREKAITFDPKSELQEYAQKIYKKRPEYKVIDEDGPSHKRLYRIMLCLEDIKCEGTGRTKREAMRDAAMKALKLCFIKK